MKNQKTIKRKFSRKLRKYSNPEQVQRMANKYFRENIESIPVYQKRKKIYGLGS